MPTRRISLDLPGDLVDRLEVQAECMNLSRATLIEAACTGLVREFEQIDTEEGRPCTCGSPKAHARFCAYKPRATDAC